MKIEKIEENLERLKAEVEKREEARIIEETRRKTLLAEKKLKQENLLRQEQEKKARKIKKRMLEERWEMARWISKYISENEERWAREKRERESSERKWLEDWGRMTRKEKIRKIREKEIDMRKVEAKIIPERLQYVTQFK